MPLFWRIDASDLMQGSLGNCWFVAAVAALAEYPLEVESLFSGSSHTSGRYVVRLHDAHGRAHEVIVDEYVPVYPSRIQGWEHLQHAPLFAKPNGEIWPLLLEKAAAKLMGSYGAMSGGTECAAFRMLTGEVEQEMWKRSFHEACWKQWLLDPGSMGTYKRRSSAPSSSDDELWSTMATYCNSLNYLIAASIRADGERRRRDGLVEGHAYTILCLTELDDVRLIKLRNPWGAVEWTGAWSDRSDLWAQHPAIAEMVAFRSYPNGVFHMSFPDFCARFTSVEVSHKTMRMGQPQFVAAREIPDSSLPSSGERCTVKCPHGHPLVPYAPSTERCMCDSCDRQAPRGGRLFGCRRCNFDLCMTCLSAHAGSQCEAPSAAGLASEEAHVRRALEASAEEAPREEKRRKRQREATAPDDEQVRQALEASARFCEGQRRPTSPVDPLQIAAPDADLLAIALCLSRDEVQLRQSCP